ncbi:MAG: energy transducer TonB [Psychroflexus sp.]|nr:energy transducer TonB [Psychroflexus sp.]MDN6310428.1 energy transducer TonB [Psychroflexus sp.]
MKFLKTKHQKKSFVITSIIYAVLILLMLVFGFKYFDPPIEKGIAVNFGTTDFGSGDTQPKEPIKTSPQESTPEPTPVEESSSVAEEEDIINQDTEEAPVIEEDKKEKPKKEQKEKTQEKPVEKQPEKEEPKEEPVPEPEPEPQPDKSVTDAMESLMNGPENDGQESDGEGDDQKSGDKGDPDGDPNAKNYYGTGKGLDGDGKYRLGGRKALNKERYTQDCNESGEVVVRIEVDRNGNVIKATPGVKGTTNSSPCLLEPAKRAALDTRFNKDTDAPSKQVGFITYVFKLSE